VQNYTVAIDFDHAARVASGSSRTDGNDVRLLYWTGSAWQELHRVLDSSSGWNQAATRLWVKLPVAVASNSSFTLWMYGGNPNADSPLADPRQVFLFYDGFESGDLSSWDVAHSWRWAVQSAVKRSGIYAVRADDDHYQSGSFITAKNTLVADVAFDAYWRFSDDSQSISQAVRVNPFDDYEGYYLNQELNLGWVLTSWNNGTWTELTNNYGNTYQMVGEWVRFTVLIANGKLKALKDGVQFVPASGTINVSALATGTIGFQSYIIFQGDDWWIDDVSARHYVDPEPVVSLIGADQCP
jgi:hypothetical protein